MVRIGEELFFGGGRRFRVLDVVIFEEEDESSFVGLLQVEAAGSASINVTANGFGPLASAVSDCFTTSPCVLGWHERELRRRLADDSALAIAEATSSGGNVTRVRFPPLRFVGSPRCAPCAPRGPSGQVWGA
jgi:hypothetical protein